MKKLKLAFSTCPNDTFMFDALVNHRISTEGFSFDLQLADIEELNSLVSEGIPDISKMSIAAYPLVAGQYELLRAGAAIGFGNGPLLVSKKKIFPDELKDIKIAIPGEKTTANLLLKTLYPDAINKVVYLFSAIEEVVLDNECDAGLLIHETRFTYESRGLKKIVDLGEEWEKRTGLPIPLGAIGIRRNLPLEVKRKINEILRQSISFGLANPLGTVPFMREHARELSEEVMYKHVQLYVNQFSVDVGLEGEKAVVTLFQNATEAGLLPATDKAVFISHNIS